MKCKSIGYYHVFPYEAVKKDSEIIIWGMGEVGQHYIKQIQMTKYCRVKYAVDKNWRNIRLNEIKVLDPSVIRQEKNRIPVVIANGSGAVAGDIKKQLLAWGYPAQLILWKDYIVGQRMVIEAVESKLADIGTPFGKYRQPYLEGSESKSITRLHPPAHAGNIIKGWEIYDVISFDIFGTAVFQPFVNPTDLFFIIEEDLRCPGFHDARIQAEKKAREIAMANRGSDEVSLEEVYEQLKETISLDVEKTRNMEIDKVIEFTTGNPYMLDVYLLCRGKGKKLIFNEDTYYSGETLERILKKCGYSEWDAVFSSSDYCVSKKDYGLYKLIKSIYGKHALYEHLGDDPVLDVANGRKNGFHVRPYQNVNLLGNCYRATFNGMSRIIGSLYGGIVNIHLYNGLRSYSPAYEFGYVYSGIYVLGVLNWLLKQSNENNCESMLIVGSNGGIYQRVLQIIDKEKKVKHIRWSTLFGKRMQAVYDGVDVVSKYLKNNWNLWDNYRVTELMRMMHLDSMEHAIIKYQIHPQQLIDEKVMNRFVKFLNNSWMRILPIYQEEAEITKACIKAYIKDAHNIAIMDDNIPESQADLLKYLIESCWKIDVNVYCFRAGSYAADDGHNYLFANNMNYSLYEYHRYAGGGGVNELFRWLVPSDELDFMGVEFEGEKLRARFDSKSMKCKANIYTDIVKGLTNFMNDFQPCLESIDEFLSGYDAYIPFMTISRNKEFINIYLDG